MTVNDGKMTVNDGKMTANGGQFDGKMTANAGRFDGFWWVDGQIWWVYGQIWWVNFEEFLEMSMVSDQRYEAILSEHSYFIIYLCEVVTLVWRWYDKWNILRITRLLIMKLGQIQKKNLDFIHFDPTFVDERNQKKNMGFWKWNINNPCMFVTKQSDNGKKNSFVPTSV